jgi:hypothetical protein
MNVSVNIYHISHTISSRKTRKFSVAVLKLDCLTEYKKKIIHYTNIYVRIRGSRSGRYEELSLIGYNAIYFSSSSSCSELEHKTSVKRFASLQFPNLRETLGLLGRWISHSQGRYLTQHRINTNRHQCLESYSSPRSQCSSA